MAEPETIHLAEDNRNNQNRKEIGELSVTLTLFARAGLPVDRPSVLAYADG